MSDTTDHSTPTHPGWDGILDPGETILWQGRPDQSFKIDFGAIFGAVFGLVFAVFALFWMIMAASMGAGFWMFGLIHFTVGLGLTWKSVFGTTYRRRRSWYTLTDRRAFIATKSWRRGRDLKSYPITASSEITYFDGRFATIFFAREQRVGHKGRRYSVAIGFERITEGDKVMRLIRQVQNGGPLQ